MKIILNRKMPSFQPAEEYMRVVFAHVTDKIWISNVRVNSIFDTHEEIIVTCRAQGSIEKNIDYKTLISEAVRLRGDLTLISIDDLPQQYNQNHFSSSPFIFDDIQQEINREIWGDQQQSDFDDISNVYNPNFRQNNMSDSHDYFGNQRFIHMKAHSPTISEVAIKIETDQFTDEKLFNINTAFAKYMAQFENYCKDVYSQDIATIQITYKIENQSNTITEVTNKCLSSNKIPFSINNAYHCLAHAILHNKNLKELLEISNIAKVILKTNNDNSIQVKVAVIVENQELHAIHLFTTPSPLTPVNVNNMNTNHNYTNTK